MSEIIWFQFLSLFFELHHQRFDNTWKRFLIVNLTFRAHTEYMDIDFHFIWEHVKVQQLLVFTKLLSKQYFSRLTIKLTSDTFIVSIKRYLSSNLITLYQKVNDQLLE